MRPEARGYLRDLARRLKLDPERKQEILQELEGHVEDRAQAFQDRGLDPDEAMHRSLELLGQPRHLARQYYAIHSFASWSDVIISILPHLLFAALFALHLWTVSFWVALFLISAAVITVTAWRRGQPNWIYPWLGYCLVAPVVGWALALRTMSNGIWSVLNGEPLPFILPAYLGMLVYMVLVLALLWSILRRVLRRDWLYASLAALPFPFLTAWLIYLGEHGGYFNYDAGRLLEMDGATALLFMGLAITTGAVYRLGQRAFRVAVLALATPLLALMGALSYQGSILSGSVFLVLTLGIAILALPAYIDARLSHGHEGEHRAA